MCCAVGAHDVIHPLCSIWWRRSNAFVIELGSFFHLSLIFIHTIRVSFVRLPILACKASCCGSVIPGSDSGSNHSHSVHAVCVCVRVSPFRRSISVGAGWCLGILGFFEWNSTLIGYCREWRHYIHTKSAWIEMPNSSIAVAIVNIAPVRHRVFFCLLFVDSQRWACWFLLIQLLHLQLFPSSSFFYYYFIPLLPSRSFT